MLRGFFAFLLVGVPVLVGLAAQPAEARPTRGGRGGGRSVTARRVGVRPGFPGRSVAVRTVGFRGRVGAGVFFGAGFGAGGFGLPGYASGYGSGGNGSGNYFPYSMSYGGYASPASGDAGMPAAGEPSLAEGPTSSDHQAHLKVQVPENATLWVDGEKMDQPGTDREFVSPPLEAGKKFVYTFRVRYTNDKGEVVDQTRKVYVRAADRWLVDFTKPAPRTVNPLPAPPEVP